MTVGASDCIARSWNRRSGGGGEGVISIPDVTSITNSLRGHPVWNQGGLIPRKHVHLEVQSGISQVYFRCEGYIQPQSLSLTNI